MDGCKRAREDRPTSLSEILGKRDGMALVSALYILAAVAFLAAGMAGDTLTDYKIAGNRRIQQQVFYLADGGANIGVQIVRDMVVNRDEGLVDPETDYPLVGAVPLNAAGTFVMENFTMDAAHVIDDLYGFEENDNDRDGTDPEDTDPAPDILFDLVQHEPESTLRTKVALDLDLLGREPWGDIKFATGYDDPASNKWVYFFSVGSRATDTRGANPSGRPNAEVADVYAVLK